MTLARTVSVVTGKLRKDRKALFFKGY